MTKSVVVVPSFLAAALFAQASWGVPVLNPNCPSGFQIREPKNSSGYALSKDCKVVYVLPPAVGRVSLSALSPNGNLGLCSSIKSLRASTGFLTKALESISSHKLDVVESKRAEFAALQKTKKELALKRQSLAKVEGDLSQAKATNEALAENAVSAQQRYVDCQSKKKDCRYEEILFKRAEREKAKHQQGALAVAQATKAAAEKSVEALQGQEADIQVSLIKTDELLGEIEREVEALRTQVWSAYKDYAGIEGATAQLSFKTEFTKLRQEFESLNSGRGLSFEQIRTTSSTLVASALIGGESTGIPAVLETQIPGLKVTEESATMGESVGGLVRLSLVGACPLFKDSNKPISSVRPADLSANLVVNRTHSYELQAERHYKATYKLSTLAERISRSSEAGGFLQTSAVNEVVNSNRVEDWFSIEFSSNASGFEHTPEEQDQITREVKASLIDRVVGQIANLQMGVKSLPEPAKPKPIDTGAKTGERYLDACPHLYCQVAAAILGTSDALFGNKETVARFINENRGTSVDESRGARMIRYTGTMTFEP